MKNFTAKNVLMVIIPTGITYLTFFKDFKFVIALENFIPIIAAVLICSLMIYIVHIKNQKERILDAIEANFDKQRLVNEFLLTKLNLTDEFNDTFEKLKDSIKDNESLARTLIDKRLK